MFLFVFLCFCFEVPVTLLAMPSTFSIEPSLVALSFFPFLISSSIRLRLSPILYYYLRIGVEEEEEEGGGGGGAGVGASDDV